MRLLWYLFIGLVVLGSIYPFDFTTSSVTAEAVGAFLGSCCGVPGRGDAAGNILLFMPLGFLGMLGIWLEKSVPRRVLRVFAASIAIAFLLQVLQLFLPSRDENLQDVLWNAIGVLAGVGVAFHVTRMAEQSKEAMSTIAIAPIALISAWLIYRLLPFVPSLDWQVIKDSVKPIIYDPVSLTDSLATLVAWLVVAYLLRESSPGRNLDRHIASIVAITCVLEVLIIGNTLSAANVIGAIGALAVWYTILRNKSGLPVILLSVLIVSLFLSGLAPYEFRLTAADFSWLPFGGFLRGSMFINTLSAAEKTFLYGSLVYLLWDTKFSRWTGTAIAVSIVFVIEFTQTLVVGHTPEITDPLLVFLAALALSEISRSYDAPTLGQARLGSAQRFLADEQAEAAVSHVTSQKQTVSINLRQNQLEFLQELAGELNESPSTVVAQIIDRFIVSENAARLRDTADQDWLAAGPGSTRIRNRYRASQISQRWVSYEIELESTTRAALLTIGANLNLSASRIIRRMIFRLMEDQY